MVTAAVEATALNTSPAGIDKSNQPNPTVGVQLEAATCKLGSYEAAGTWKLAAGWELEACRRKLEAGNWKLETGNWKLETGSWKLEAQIVVRGAGAAGISSGRRRRRRA